MLRNEFKSNPRHRPSKCTLPARPHPVKGGRPGRNSGTGRRSSESNPTGFTVSRLLLTTYTFCVQYPNRIVAAKTLKSDLKIIYIFVFA